MTGQALTTCLWFITRPRRPRASTPASSRTPGSADVHRHTEAGPGPAGTVMLVEFELNGQKFTALNGGPQPFAFNEAVSFVVPCADQAEVDYYWRRCSTAAGSPASAAG